MRWRRHYLICDPIRFLLVDVAGLPDPELGLLSRALVTALGTLASHRVITATAFALQNPERYRHISARWQRRCLLSTCDHVCLRSAAFIRSSIDIVLTLFQIDEPRSLDA
jgi:hypothetical protein